MYTAGFIRNSTNASVSTRLISEFDLSQCILLQHRVFIQDTYILQLCSLMIFSLEVKALPLLCATILSSLPRIAKSREDYHKGNSRVALSVSSIMSISIHKCNVHEKSVFFFFSFIKEQQICNCPCGS